MRPNNRTGKGFTLIELLIVIAIIGILAAIAYPSYTRQVEQTRRSDAQGALTGLASAMERHYTENNSYLGAAVGGNTGAPEIYSDEVPIGGGGDKFYDLRIDAATATTYTLQAIPKNAQLGDGFLELRSTGARGWDRNDNGAIDGDEDKW